MNAVVKPINQTDPESKAPMVYAAISGVMAELAAKGISKDKKNQQQGYNFRGIDDMYNAIAPILARHHLILLPRVTNRAVTERTTKNGGVLFYVTIDVQYTLISASDGSQHTVDVIGEAMDSADKATNKAMSAAYKYMCLQVFCIPTEASEDADMTTHELSSLMAQDAYEALKVKVTDSGGDVAKWEDYMKACYPRGVPANAHDTIVAGIEKAAAKRNAS